MAQSIEERVSKLEGALEQMNERLGGIESNIASLRQEMGGLRQEMNNAIGELRHDLTTNFRWTMGTVVLMWVTIICTILFA